MCVGTQCVPGVATCVVAKIYIQTPFCIKPTGISQLFRVTPLGYFRRIGRLVIYYPHAIADNHATRRAHAPLSRHGPHPHTQRYHLSRVQQLTATSLYSRRRRWRPTRRSRPTTARRAPPKLSHHDGAGAQRVPAARTHARHAQGSQRERRHVALGPRAAHALQGAPRRRVGRRQPRADQPPAQRWAPAVSGSQALGRRVCQ